MNTVNIIIYRYSVLIILIQMTRSTIVPNTNEARHHIIQYVLSEQGVVKADTEKVDCTFNVSICHSGKSAVTRTTCMDSAWYYKDDDQYHQNKEYFCVCLDTMAPMREDFTCPPPTNNGLNVTKLFRLLKENSSIENPEPNSTTNPSLDHVDNTLWSVHMVIVTVFLVLVFIIVVLEYLWRCLVKKQINYSENAMALSIPLNTWKNPNYQTINAESDIQEGAVLLFPGIRVIERSNIEIFDEVMGEGQFGLVYKGTLHEDNNPQTIAIKLLKKVDHRNNMEEEFIRELNVMSFFNHPNVLGIIGYCPRDEHNGPWMVVEYMSGGDLLNVLKNCKLSLSTDNLLCITQQIACGMKYLTEQHFVHRDLACRNCLMGPPGVVKIADFGLTRDIYTSNYYEVKGSSRALPIRWMAPEAIQSLKFTEQTDIWSFGVVMYEVFTYGKVPYHGRSNKEVLDLINKGKLIDIPEEFLPGVKAIITRCWQTKPSMRIRFDETVRVLTQLIEDRRSYRSQENENNSGMDESNDDYDDTHISGRIEKNVQQSHDQKFN